jgi:hypothetical protein
MEDLKQETLAQLEQLYDRAMKKGDEELADLILLILADKQNELCS